MATPPRTALRLSHEEAETSERRDEVERERERGAVCGFGRYADRRSRCAVCNIARRTVVAWATPSVTLRLFYPGPVVGLVSLESRQKKTARSGKDDRGKMIVYDGLDVTIGVIDAP